MSEKWTMNFNNIEITDAIKQAINDWQDDAGIREVAEIQVNTPVLTGALRRSIDYEKKNKKLKYCLRFGSDLDYAGKVEYKNKSYLRSTLNRDIGDLETSLMQKIREAMQNS